MTAWSFRATIAAVPGTVCNIVLVITNKVSAPLGVFTLWRCFPWREKRRLFVYAFTQLTKYFTHYFPATVTAIPVADMIVVPIVTVSIMYMLQAVRAAFSRLDCFSSSCSGHTAKRAQVNGDQHHHHIN